ncbi:MAG: 30S ribosomal protein S17 [Patescibacteria group bacterium]|nr:30S ribosomal protein S17 [Patescibacteria group bacterium]
MKRKLKGKVVSDKAAKTVSVLVERHKIHPIYKKRFVSSKKFLAQNDIDAKVGDFVLIEETKPISKNKKWSVIKKIDEKEVK